MGRIRESFDPDRYLAERNGNYYYKRRVPTRLVQFDSRGVHVRLSLKTSDLAKARAMRDVYERADDELWASLTLGLDEGGARGRYMAAVKRAEVMGFTYRHANDIASERLETILQRVEALQSPQVARPIKEALLGVVSTPTVNISQAFEIYKSEIVPHELSGKSPAQKKKWEAVKRLALTYFTDVVGDIAMSEIDRDHARKFYQYWMDRIAPKEGKATHGASIGNRAVGSIRVLYRAYFQHVGEPDRKNPFDGLSFNERKKRRRPPFKADWISKKILANGALSGMNAEARAVVLTLIETGARPSEICNLTRSGIVLDDEIPHLNIEPRDDPDDPREIKTASSVRYVPLVGVALEAMRKFPDGFPRYKDKESSMSAALNKFFRENDLFPSDKHTIYSLRHAFEDRMKEAGIDSELRRILMGHTIDRPQYGEGGSLEWRHGELKKIVLPFDPSIV